MLHLIFVHFLRTTYTYYCTCTRITFTSRGRANLCIPVACFMYSSRGRALCYRIPSLRIRWAFAPHLRRVVTVSLCVAQQSLLIESRYLVSKLCVICYRAVRRGLGFTPGPRPCSCVDSSFSFCRPDSLALSLEIPSVARDSLTQREAQTHSRRLPSTSLGGGECGGYLLVLATVPRCRALHILSRR